MLFRLRDSEDVPIRHQESDIARRPCSIFASREKPEQFCQFEDPSEPVGLDEEC